MYMGSVPLLSCYTTVSWRVISAVLRCDVLPTTHLQGLYTPHRYLAPPLRLTPFESTGYRVALFAWSYLTDRQTDPQTHHYGVYRTSIWPRAVKSTYFTKFAITVTRGRGFVFLWRQWNICCLLPVLWMTSCFHMMGHISHLRLWQAVCPCFRIFEFRTGDKVCYPRLPCITCT